MIKFKKFILCCLSILLILTTMCPTLAYASGPVLFPCSEPYVGDYGGYVAVKGVRTDLDNVDRSFLVIYTCVPKFSSYDSAPTAPYFTVTSMYSYKICFDVQGDTYTSYDLSVTILHQDGSIQGIYSHSFTGSGSYEFAFHSEFSIEHMDFQGLWDTSELSQGYGYTTFDYLFSEDKYEYLYLLMIVNLLQYYGDLTVEQLAALEDIYTSSQNIEDILTELVDTFSVQIAEVIKLQTDTLSAMLDAYAKLDANTDELESLLTTANSYLTFIRDYVCEYLPKIEEVLWVLDSDFLIVMEQLDVIIDLLQPDTEINVSTVDPSNFNEYNKAEQSLLDNSNIDVSNALNVEIDQNALLFIWPLVENILNTHPQVIGLVFTILSISIVALVLGRRGG